MNEYANSLALSSAKHGLNLLRVWSLQEAFSQTSSICFLHLSWLSIVIPSNFTKNVYTINTQIIGVNFASSKNHKLEFSRISF